ncbi:MAG: sodium:calcium antiporter [Planctomycetota bacterium]
MRDTVSGYPLPTIDFLAVPLLANLVVFTVAAGAVWLAGTRLATRADQLARAAGWNQALVGAVLLAGATELPEVVTSLTAAGMGNAPMAVNNLFGGVVLQTALLAVADFTVRGGSLTFFAPDTRLLLQGLTLILLLALALAALALGEQISYAGVGASSLLIAAAYVASVVVLKRSRAAEQWSVADTDVPPPAAAERTAHDTSRREAAQGFALAAAVILVAGYAIAGTGEALAQQTGVGSSFVGAVLIAATTSLPELSTTLTSVRLGAYRMAVANIFGSNAVMLLLLFLCDAAYRPGPILDAAGPSALFGAAMGIVVTVVYLVGIVERRNRSVGNLGLDSVLVLVIYAVTVTGFYLLRAHQVAGPAAGT